MCFFDLKATLISLIHRTRTVLQLVPNACGLGYCPSIKTNKKGNFNSVLLIQFSSFEFSLSFVAGYYGN